MSKELRIRIFSFIPAALLSFCGTAYSVTLIARADTPKTWADVGEDAVKLKDAYLSYIQNVASGDIVGALCDGLVDVPLSWLKTLADGTLAISPVDDLYYYFVNGELQYEDNREHRAGGGGGKRRGSASEIQPEVPAYLAKQVKDYWSEYYKPAPNVQQYIYSYQSTGSTDDRDSFNGYYYLKSKAKIYYGGQSWGGKGWRSLYILPFLVDDFSGSYYGMYYAHLYSSRDDSKQGYLNLDFYSVSTGDLFSSYSTEWNVDYQYISSFPCADDSFCFEGFKTFEDYMSNADVYYKFSYYASDFNNFRERD